MTQPLTDAINALTRYANEVTGQSDITLSDAVRTLCDGYGGGGGISFPLLHEFSVTIEADTTSFSIEFANTLAYNPILVSFIPDGEVINPPSGVLGVITGTCFKNGGRSTTSANTTAIVNYNTVASAGHKDYYASGIYATVSTTGVTVIISRTKPVLKFITGQKFKVLVMETTDYLR